jgi:hypothetical protein
LRHDPRVFIRQNVFFLQFDDIGQRNPLLIPIKKRKTSRSAFLLRRKQNKKSVISCCERKGWRLQGMEKRAPFTKWIPDIIQHTTESGIGGPHKKRTPV